MPRMRLARASVFLVLSLDVFGCAGAGTPDARPEASGIAPRPVAAPGPVATGVSMGGRLTREVRPREYRLRLDVDPNRDSFAGHVDIDLELSAATSEFVLHGRDVTPKLVDATSPGLLHRGALVERRAKAGRPADELVLRFEPALPRGAATVRIDYTGAVSSSLSGLYRAESRGQRFLFTQHEPADARRLMPCFDDPREKTPFEIAVHVPKGVIALSNGPERERKDDAAGTLFVFAKTPPLPTYLVALAVGDFDIEAHPRDARLRVVAPRTMGHLARGALEPAAAMLASLERTLGVPYPYAKLDLVAVPDFGPGAMENAGLITFRDDLLLLDGKKASPRAIEARDHVMAHELAHQWFGNLVTMQWWDDLWLSESFATWLSARVMDEVRPETRTSVEAVRKTAWIMAADELASARPLHRAEGIEPEDAFDALSYDKGAAILSMTERRMGRQKFAEALRGYLTAHAHGSATATDLFASIAAKDPDAALVLRSFVEQAGVPAVTVERECRGKAASFVLSQFPWAPLGGAPPPRPLPQWTIPYCLGAPPKTERCHVLREHRTELPVAEGCGVAILPNKGRGAYVRSSLRAEHLKQLVRDVAKLDVEDRIGLVADAWAMTRAGDIEPKLLLATLEAFDQERDRLVVQQLIDVLYELSEYAAADAPRLRDFVRTRLAAHRRRLGWGSADARLGRVTPRDGDGPRETALLRQAVLRAAGELGDDDDTLRDAEALTRGWLTGQDGPPMELLALAVELASRRASAERWVELTARLEKATLPEERVFLLRALGTFKDETLVVRSLDFALAKLSHTDLRRLFDAAVSSRGARPTLLAWTQANWDRLNARFEGGGGRRITELLARACDRGTITDIQAFLRARPWPEGHQRVREATDRAQRCVDLSPALAPLLTTALATPAASPRGTSRDTGP